MKKIIYSLFLLFTFSLGFSQASFWTENFGTGCNQGTQASGYTSGNGTWVGNITGTNGTFANAWFISGTEAGMGVGNCGSGCLSNSTYTNQTLHIGSTLVNDVGAAYLAGTAGQTDKRIESPSINCTGKSNMKMQFNYFENGIASSDFFEIVYSTNGGSTWTSLITPPATPAGTCSPQGKWATYTVNLPAACNNQANVKIGFRWQNIDANGADPSVAIDDIALSVNTTFTPSFTLNGPICQGGSVTVTANTGTVVATGYTWTAAPVGPTFSAPNASVTNITFGAANVYTVTLSVASGTNFGIATRTIQVNAAPNSVTFTASSNTICAGSSVTLTATGATNYTWFPGSATSNPIVYTPGSTTTYTVVGANGPCIGNSSIKQVTVVTCTGLQEIAAYNNLFTISPNPNNGEFSLEVNTVTETISYGIYNSLGQLVSKDRITSAKTPVNIKTFPQGIYHVIIYKDNRVIYKTKVVKN